MHSGTPPDPPADPRANHLLAVLPPQVLAALGGHLQRVALSSGQLLSRIDQSVQSVYFPLTCVVALCNVGAKGGAVQVALVGCEGMVGIDAFLGSAACTTSQVVGSGVALRASSQALAAEFERSPPLRNVLLGYVPSVLSQFAQAALCNRHHSPEQQLCLLLLLNLDRMKTDELVMTHDLIGGLLGLRRETVTQAAKRVQAKGYVRYTRGHIHVLDRNGLVRAACPCYQRLQALAPTEADAGVSPAASA